MEFLYEVFASTRRDELAPLNWTPAQQDVFLRMQFNAQHQDYHRNFPGADFMVVILSGSPVGRLYVARLPDQILVVDISILPGYRNRGLGTALIQALMSEAATAGKPLRIHVEQHNPALRLYTRLGFRGIAQHGIYLLMQWAEPA
jgi:ribosomal protein S18 acetylase RimI-like enzyme